MSGHFSKKPETTAPSDSGVKSSELQKNSKANPFYNYTPESSTAPSELNSSTIDKDHYINDLNSEFYRILFRGGISCNNKQQNRFSNAASRINNSKLLAFLKRLANFYKTIDTEAENVDLLDFMKLYDTKSFTSNKTAFIYAKDKAGGIKLSELILSIFAALIWHQPSIRYEQLFKTTDSNKVVPVRNDLVSQALKIAESTRMFIIGQQHQLKLKQQSNATCDKGSSPSLIDIIHERVMYLLKVERLTERLVKYEFNRQNSISFGFTDTYPGKNFIFYF